MKEIKRVFLHSNETRLTKKVMSQLRERLSQEGIEIHKALQQDTDMIISGGRPSSESWLPVIIMGRSASKWKIRL